MHTIRRTTVKHHNIICRSLKAKVMAQCSRRKHTLRGEEQQGHLLGCISTVQDLILYLKNICSVLGTVDVVSEIWS